MKWVGGLRRLWIARMRCKGSSHRWICFFNWLLCDIVTADWKFLEVPSQPHFSSLRWHENRSVLFVLSPRTLLYSAGVYAQGSQGLLGPFKSLKLWFCNNRPFKSFDSSHGSFLFVGRSFKVNFWATFQSRSSEQQYLRTGSCIFAAVPLIAMWLLELSRLYTRRVAIKGDHTSFGC